MQLDEVIDQVLDVVEAELGIALGSGPPLKTSGNLKTKIAVFEHQEIVDNLADVWWDKNEPRADIFNKAFEWGRLVKQRPAYWVRIGDYWYYFIGDEAEVHRKITAYEEEKAKKEASKDKANESLKKIDPDFQLPTT